VPRYAISDWVDVLHVQSQTLRFTQVLGFSKRECGELAIVASELTSNVLKYGVRGSIQLDALEDTRGQGVVLVAEDIGPPFQNLELALLDGNDDRGPIDPLDMLTRKGIGGGLGAIVRLSHSFQVEPLPVGKRVRVTRYLRRLSKRPRAR
jgi:anti-sigma regulatory factor (Ser/Thr protein kinase)